MTDKLSEISGLEFLRRAVEQNRHVDSADLRLILRDFSALEQRVERLERGLRNTVRHYREDNCTDAASCPYLDAAESALAEEEA